MSEYSLKQIVQALNALDILGGDKEAVTKKLEEASAALDEALSLMDEIQVKGRKQVDTVLACMMTVESMVGKE